MSKNPLGWRPGSPTLDPRLPTLSLQAQEHGSRPRILSGLGEAGGEPIDTPARGLRVERLPQVLSIMSLYTLPWHFPGNRTFKGGLAPHLAPLIA